MSRKKVKKLVLLGWDAAEWKIINPLIEQGLMPTLKKFLEEGTSGKIETLDPPFSPMLWTSIATGKRAYDHGVMGFIEPLPTGDGLRPVMSSSRKVKAIWNILNQEGLRSNVIGWWPSHPVDKINGVMVSNFYQPVKDKIDKPWPMPEGTVHPENLAEEFKKMRVHADEITLTIIESFIPKVKEIIDKFLPISKDESLTEEERKKANSILTLVSNVTKNIATCATIHSAGTYSLANTEWDFTAIYLDTIDHLCHIGMKFHPPKMKSIDPEFFEYFKDIVTAGYRFHDMLLERVLKLVDEDTTVLILSDHGFHPDHQRPNFLPKEPASPAHEHSPYGFFAIKGPGIKKGDTIYGASLVDVTPTLLHLFGLPVGKDMEGKVLNQIFNDNEKEEPEFIPSWENVEGNDGRIKLLDQEDAWASAEAMQQLIDLGYIEKPDENKANAVEAATYEAKFYLARAYIDGGKTKEGIDILEEITAKKPDVLRYKLKLIPVYTNNRNFKKCRDLIENVKTLEDYPVNKLMFYEGLLDILTHRPKKAAKIFEELKTKNPNISPKLLYHLGRAYNMRYMFNEAEVEFKNAIQLDPFENLAFHGLGYSYLKRSRYDEAIEAFLNAIEISNYMPGAHFNLGEALFKTGRYEAAANAFSYALSLKLNMPKCHHWLYLTYDKLGLTDLAKKHKDIYENNHKGDRIIVTGLRRSGTSLMMQVLRELGVDILYDDVRKPDEFNPKGYFDYSKTINLVTDKIWVDDCADKAVKVNVGKLTELPNDFKYKIIWMNRSMNDIIDSYHRTKGKKENTYDSGIANNLAAKVEKAQIWIDSHPNTELVIVDLNELLTNTETEIQSIANMLDLEIDIEEKTTAVKKLFRMNNVLI
jgi:predicted AlkP superfamily phosphohydrolase/phosphomutase/tetratricopeptide (TPR) repeat protein